MKEPAVTPTTQFINADVSGNVAGRDIFQVSYYPPERALPEWQLQAEFASRTGIWCPKNARAWLEWAMEHHQFTVRDLALAWRSGSIGWHPEKNQKTISTPTFDAVFAWTLFALFTVYVLSMGILLAFGNYAPHEWKKPLSALVLALIYVGVCWLLNRYMLLPRRVALRLKRVDQDNDHVPGNEWPDLATN